MPKSHFCDCPNHMCVIVKARFCGHQYHVFVITRISTSHPAKAQSHRTHAARTCEHMHPSEHTRPAERFGRNKPEARPDASTATCWIASRTEPRVVECRSGVSEPSLSKPSSYTCQSTAALTLSIRTAHNARRRTAHNARRGKRTRLPLVSMRSPLRRVT